MENYQCEAAEWALRCYVDAVADALGLGPEGSYCELNDQATAYLALEEGSLPGYETRECALLWDERYGWAVAVETVSGEDLLVHAYLGGDIVAEPEAVADFVTGMLTGARTGQLFPPRVWMCSDLVSELFAYSRAPGPDQNTD